MQYIKLETVIVVGVIATSMSFVPMLIVLIRKYKEAINQHQAGLISSLSVDASFSEKDMNQIFKVILKEYKGCTSLRKRDLVRKNLLDSFALGINADTLLQLKLLPRMKHNRMINTVTDVLGLNLSVAERQYAYHMIKNNIADCKKNSCPNNQESVEQVFERVLKQIAI